MAWLRHVVLKFIFIHNHKRRLPGQLDCRQADEGRVVGVNQRAFLHHVFFPLKVSRLC